MTIHRLDTDSIELTLWRMTTADDEVRCVVVVPDSDATRFEAQIHMNGKMLYAYTLPNLTEAVSWAEMRRARWARRGWTSEAQDSAAQAVSVGRFAPARRVSDWHRPAATPMWTH